MENLDRVQILMVLGGETDFSRTDNAVRIHNEIGPVNGARIPIYLSGDHSGLNGIYLDCKPQSEVMRERALSLGVSDEYLIPEKKRVLREGAPEVGSLDTLANFVFARDLIPENFDSVGIFTEQGHIKRSLWCGWKVFGNEAEFFPFPSEPDVMRGSIGKLQEKVAGYALKFDLRNIREGDGEAIQRYMREVHPWYALPYGNEPQFSFYGLMTKLGKIAAARSGEKVLYE